MGAFPTTVAEGGTRGRPRDSMFLQAVLRPSTGTSVSAAITVRVRNISASGLMAESDLAIVAQDRIVVELRNVGPVHGTVAWINGKRFGVAFDAPIDPKLARKTPKVAPEPLMSKDGYRKIVHPLG